MKSTQALMTKLYGAFNQRDTDRALALMLDDVSWPKASEGGRIQGKDEIRAYWKRQWMEFDPHVEPIEILELGDAKVKVRVHQLVRSLSGEVLSDTQVWHVYTLSRGLVARMDIGETGESSESEPSAAFSRHER